MVATGGPEDYLTFDFSARMTESFTKEPMHHFYQFLKNHIKKKKTLKTCNISICTSLKHSFGAKSVVLGHMIINDLKDLNSLLDLQKHLCAPWVPGPAAFTTSNV